MQIVDPSLLGNLSPSTLATSLRSQTSSYLSESTSVATPNHNELQIQQNATPASIVINISDGGSTGRGIIIGLLSAFGSAGIAVLVLAIFFFFKYTNRGRILLDRIGRPGEFDDEQAFIKEEAEALEQMDEMQKAEYMRAKGEISHDVRRTFRAFTNIFQHLFKQIRPKPSRPTYRYRSSLLSRKKVFQHGNSNQNLRSPIVLLKQGQR